MTRPVETLRDARVRLLRAFTVELGGRTLGVSGWRLRKAWHLVALLALEPGQALHRERLMELLWPVHRLPPAAPRCRLPRRG